MAYYPALKTPRGGQNVHLHFIDAQSLKLQIVKANVSHPRSKHFKIKNKTKQMQQIVCITINFLHITIYSYTGHILPEKSLHVLSTVQISWRNEVWIRVLSVIRLSSLLRRLCSVASCQKLAKQNLPEQLLSNVS